MLLFAITYPWIGGPYEHWGANGPQKMGNISNFENSSRIKLSCDVYSAIKPPKLAIFDGYPLITIFSRIEYKKIQIHQQMASKYSLIEG